MPAVALLQTGCLVAFAVLLGVAAWRDYRTLRIANGFSVAIIVVFALWALSGVVSGRGPSPADVAWSVACAVSVFAVGAAAFAVGGTGGGDVKLLAAATLFAGPSLLLELVLVTAIAGGLLALAALAGAPIGATAAGGAPSRWRRSIPYGPAIAVGGLWVVLARAAG
ncbi:MAG: prepilin peptidase [Pseudomonadota bacterium]